jgi:DNA-binding transcriptional LysR family regulator
VELGSDAEGVDPFWSAVIRNRQLTLITRIDQCEVFSTLPLINIRPYRESMAGDSTVTVRWKEGRLELRHLRYFAAVAETHHFGRAAEQLHLAQPALSQSVRQLERELGTALFARTTRQVHLTPAGEFLQREAQRILAAVDDAARGVKRLGEGSHGLVRISFTGAGAFSLLPRVARAVKENLPGITLEIHADLLTPAQASGLRDGSLDLGALRPPVDGDDLSLRTIENEQLVLATPTDHSLSAAGSVTMADLRTARFVAYADEHSAINDAVLRSCQGAGFSPQVEHRAPGTAVLLAFVAAGLGIALLPRSVQAAPLDGVTFHEVVDAVTIELALAWNPDTLSPPARTTLNMLEEIGLFADSATTSDTPTEATP